MRMMSRDEKKKQNMQMDFLDLHIEENMGPVFSVRPCSYLVSSFEGRGCFESELASHDDPFHKKVNKTECHC